LERGRRAAATTRIGTSAADAEFIMVATAPGSSSVTVAPALTTSTGHLHWPPPLAMAPPRRSADRRSEGLEVRGRSSIAQLLRQRTVTPDAIERTQFTITCFQRKQGAFPAKTGKLLAKGNGLL
jgi:hypothetical protein